MEPEVLHVLAPPFVSKIAEREAPKLGGIKRRSFLKKKREQPSSGATTSNIIACDTEIHWCIFKKVLNSTSFRYIFKNLITPGVSFCR